MIKVKGFHNVFLEFTLMDLEQAEHISCLIHIHWLADYAYVEVPVFLKQNVECIELTLSAF